MTLQDENAALRARIVQLEDAIDNIVSAAYYLTKMAEDDSSTQPDWYEANALDDLAVHIEIANDLMESEDEDCTDSEDRPRLLCGMCDALFVHEE
jgi:hypothetical protein